MSLIILKIGSQIITQEDGRLNKKIVSRLVKDISALKKQEHQMVLVSSGAVSGGRISGKLKSAFSVTAGTQSKDIMRKQVLAAIGQPEIIAFYKKEFQKYGLNCAQILVNRDDFANRKRYLSLKNVSRNLINLGLIPIFNENDVLSADALMFNDNDELAAMIAGMLLADRLIIITNVAGVFNQDPQNSQAKLITEIENISNIVKDIKGSKSSLGRGGMKSKIMASGLATSLGTAVNIVSGLEPRVICRLILNNEKIGTFFPPQNKKNKAIKSWLYAGASVQGKIIVNKCLADILKKKKNVSILSVGIEKVEGNFEKNTVVEVCDSRGKKIGAGRVRYHAQELKHELKNPGKRIVIHCDYFVRS